MNFEKCRTGWLDFRAAESEKALDTVAHYI